MKFTVRNLARERETDRKFANYRKLANDTKENAKRRDD